MLSSSGIHTQKSEIMKKCACYDVIHPDDPHKCNFCNRKFSACLYINELQHKITLQAIEIDQLKSDLKASENEVRRQRSDLETLNIKYITGLERIADIQQQKEQADHEMEELGARLFEEANNMVAVEKRKNHQLEERIRYTEDQLSTEQSQLFELRNRLETTATALSSQTPPPPYFSDDNTKKQPMTQQLMRFYSGNKSNSLRESSSIEYSMNTRLLFNEIKAQQNALLLSNNDDGLSDSTYLNYDKKILSDQIPRHPSDSAYFSPDYDRATATNIQTKGENNSSLFVYQNDGSGVQYNHFRDFIERQQQTCRKYNSIPSLISDRSSTDEEKEEHCYSFFQPPQTTDEFVTRSEIEDIEPCLQFGNSNSRMCIKIMMEHLSVSPCFIESITMEEARSMPSPLNAISSVYYRPIWERLTAVSSSLQQQQRLIECSACGLKYEGSIVATTTQRNHSTFSFYRFRLTEKEDWLLIDQNCRDRLVAVCNFYSFVRNIQMGHYKQRQLHDLYLESVELRLKMFYSRS